jgi:hypothetical protein
LHDNDLFLSMFLIHLQPLKQEAVGAGTHETAAAMVKAEDTLWDARGGHNPTVTAASTQYCRSPAPHSGKRGDKKSGNACSKSRPPSRPDFYSFQNPGNGICKFTSTTPTRLTGALRPVLGRKTNLPLNHFRFGSHSHIRHCHGYAFSCQCWIDFLDWRIDK